jgi:hypothetical protein
MFESECLSDECGVIIESGLPVTAESKYFGPREVDQRRRQARLGYDGRTRVWNVSTLSDFHKEVLRLVSVGMSNVDIAEQLSCSAQAVSNIRNSPVSKEHLEKLSGARDADTVDINDRINELAPRALELLENIINGTGEGEKASISLRAKEANALLDRAGFSPVRKLSSQGLSMHLTVDDIERIKERAKDFIYPNQNEDKNE